MLIERGLSGDIIAPGDGVDVFLRPSPLRQERHHLRLAAGLSLAEIVEECRSAFHMRPSQALHVSIGGHAVPADRWPRVRIKPGVTVTIVAVPGKNALRSVLAIVVSIAALFVAPIIATSLLGLTAGTTTFSIATGLIGAGITMAGSLAINALFPVAKPSVQAADTTKTLYSIGGSQNTATQYGAIPYIFGRHRVSPPYASGQYTELSGDDQYLRMIFCVGYGPMAISDIKIGETPIGKFADASYEVIENHLVQSPMYYTQPVYEESVSILLQNSDGWSQRTTADKISEISVDISFPSGVVRYQKKDGQRVNYTVTVEARYAVAGTGAWVSMGTVSITAASAQAVRRTLSVAVAQGKYDVSVRKVSGDYSGDDTPFPKPAIGAPCAAVARCRSSTSQSR